MIRYILNYKRNYKWYKENKDTFSATIAPNITTKVVDFCWTKGKPVFEIKNFGLTFTIASHPENMKERVENSHRIYEAIKGNEYKTSLV